MDSGSRNYRRFRDDGDEGGLVEIIREYKDGLIFYLNSIVGNIHTAEDLAEDTFVLLGTKKPRDKGKGSFKTWLYTIGRNIAIDHVRRNRTVCEVSDAEYLSMAADEESLEESYLREERKITLYCCDVRHVTTINYDRKVIRTALGKLNRQADEMSAKIDLCLVTSKVEYNPPFDVNSSFAEAFEAYTEKAGA